MLRKKDSKVIRYLLTVAVILVLAGLLASIFDKDVGTSISAALAVLLVILIAVLFLFSRICRVTEPKEPLVPRAEGYMMPADTPEEEEEEIKGKFPDNQ